MTTSANHQATDSQNFSALLPGLAATLEDCAAHYRDTSDAEDIHSIRVATRRIRAVLKLPANAHQPEAQALSDEAKSIADSVGATRDADVLLVTIDRMASRRDQDFAEALKPLRQALTNSANLAKGSAKRSLGSKRFGQFVDSVRDFARTTAEDSPVAANEGDKAQSSPFKELARSHKRLERRAKAAFSSWSEQDLHRMRIAAKQVRYAVETINHGERGGAAEKPLGQLRQLQDTLGEVHDLHMAAEKVTSLTERNISKWGRPTLKAAGVLVADMQSRADKLQGRTPGLYDRISGKRWKKSVQKLKKSAK